MKKKHQPSYPASTFKRLFEKPERIISPDAEKGAGNLGFDVEDIEQVVFEILGPDNFYKTMESERFPGLWQDVYKPRYRGVSLYVKLQITESEGEQTAVLIAFKIE